jgi:6,7-dimethyl-8-ribityllumazine synthase
MYNMPVIHILVSEFNEPIPSRLLDGALRAFKDKHIPNLQIVTTRVPGAFELPLASLWAAQKLEVDAVICFGVVIRGDTSHYDYVCSETARGIMNVGLETKKPIIFGVLTTENEQQAYDRCRDDQTNKGYECALAALTMIDVKSKLR